MGTLVHGHMDIWTHQIYTIDHSQLTIKMDCVCHYHLANNLI